MYFHGNRRRRHDTDIDDDNAAKVLTKENCK